MCGIAGILTKNSDLQFEQRLAKMQEVLRHRGPDDRGMYVSEAHSTLDLRPSTASVGLVHTRLSILDLSPAGHQPMQTPDGKVTIVFNGEIYNFRELRAELQSSGYEFQSESDTEVLLALYLQCGPEMVKRLRGMFAFAIWDSERQTALLARDPLGIKPLYYHNTGETLVFASELRSLVASDLLPRELSPAGLLGYLQTGSLPEPLTLLKGVHLLEAGHLLQWQKGAVEKREYWNVTKLASTRQSARKGAAGEKTSSRVRAALLESVRNHFVSDVPVGIFLSGGIDSTAILALAREAGQTKIKTFSIGFREKEFDESSLAARTARHFGAEHHEWIMSAEEGRELFTGYLAAVDQPSIDGFNTFCVSRFASKNGLKVVLSGLGGDELFAGYASFSRVPQMMRWHQKLENIKLAKLVGSALQKFGRTSRWRRLGEFFQSNGTASEAFQGMRGIFTRAEATQLASKMYGISVHHGEPEGAMAIGTPIEQVGCLELSRYMRNQLLRDSDVMSMAWGLELRVPFVDSVLVSELFSLPADERLRCGKKLLLEAVPEVPQWIYEQPKRGFSFPFQEWLAADWKESFETLESKAGMPLDNWYEKWSLFVLEHAIARLHEK